MLREAEAQRKRKAIAAPFRFNWGKNQTNLENCGTRFDFEIAQRLQTSWKSLACTLGYTGRTGLKPKLLLNGSFKIKC